MRRIRFQTWCKRDPDDERKINYCLTDADGKEIAFTSEDLVPLSMLFRVKDAWVRSVVLIGEEWYADIYEED